MSSFDDDELARIGADATVLVNARHPITAATLTLVPSIRLIQAIGVGMTIDLDAAAAAGAVVAFNPGVNRIAPRSMR